MSELASESSMMSELASESSMMSGLASESSILIFDRTGRIDLDWGPISLHLAGRAVFFLWVTLALLAISGSRCSCPASASWSPDGRRGR